MKEMKSKGKSLDEVDFKPDISDQLFAPLDEITDDIIDPVTESAREVYYSYLNDEKCSFKPNFTAFFYTATIRRNT